jgi:hypothetical protein
MIDDLRQRLLDQYLRIGLESGGQVPLPPDHLFQTVKEGSSWEGGGPIQLPFDNFRMNTGYGRYSATYNMVSFSCFNEELSLLPKNPTDAKLQATSKWGESTEPTKCVMKHTYRVVLYNYCLMQYCCILFYQLVSREGCNPNQREKVSKSMDSSSIGNR